MYLYFLFLYIFQKFLPESTDIDIKESFDQVITSKKRANTDSLYKQSHKKSKVKRTRTARPAAPTKDENYIPYNAADQHTEDGLAINSFEQQAKNAEFSITNAPDEQQQKFRPGMKRWDRIKKKMVPMVDPRAGKIRTESGIWIPATYKTNRYADWKEKTKIEDQVHREMGDEGGQQGPKYPETRWGRHMANQEKKKKIIGIDRELLKPEQIVRQRMRLEHIKRKENANKIKKAANRKKHVKRVKSKSKGARK